MHSPLSQSMLLVHGSPKFFFGGASIPASSNGVMLVSGISPPPPPSGAPRLPAAHAHNKVAQIRTAALIITTLPSTRRNPDKNCGNTRALMHKRSAHRSLLVVGSVALDDIDGPFGFHRDLLGGSASFIARAASYFTRNVSVVGVVGDDFPQKHIDELAELGVDVSGIERTPGETFHWVGRYAPDLATR